MARWTVDHSHTDIQFKVKHLMINTVTGSFTDFDVHVEAEGDEFADAHISFEARVASITTNNEMRDNHLRSDDFFNAEAFPTMSFVSTRFQHLGNHVYTLEGDLTIRDITKHVKLDVVYGGMIVDPWGNIKAGFEAEGRVNRKEFGLMWNGITEAGGVVVSDEVRLHLNVQLVKSVEVESQQEVEATS